MTWALPLVAIRGVTVTIHGLFLLWIAVTFALSFSTTRVGPQLVAEGVLALLAVLAVREGVRRGMCGALGGEWPVITLWHLGSLSGPAGLPGRVARTLVVLSGFAAHLAMWPILALACVAVGVPADKLLFHPLQPHATLLELNNLQAFAWWAYYANIVVFMLNLLVPMLPLDLGRLIEIGLSRREGGEATRAAAIIGLIAATVLFSVGAYSEVSALMMIGAVGGIFCWLQIGRSPGQTQDLSQSDEEEPGEDDQLFAGMSSGKGGLSVGLKSGVELKGDGGGDRGGERGGERGEVSPGEKRAPLFPSPPVRPSRPARGVPDPLPTHPPGPLPTQSPSQPPTQSPTQSPAQLPGRGSSDGSSERPARVGLADLTDSAVLALPPEVVMDRILAKISASGLASLTERERTVLEAETKRRRRS